MATPRKPAKKAVKKATTTRPETAVNPGPPETATRAPADEQPAEIVDNPTGAGLHGNADY